MIDECYAILHLFYAIHMFFRVGRVDLSMSAQNLNFTRRAASRIPPAPRYF